jgi:hypothetical protein
MTDNFDMRSDEATVLEELFRDNSTSESCSENERGADASGGHGAYMQFFHETLAWKLDCPGCKTSLALHVDPFSDDEIGDLCIASYFCPPGGAHEFLQGEGLIVVVDGELLLDESSTGRCVMKRGDVRSVINTDQAVYRNNSETEPLRFLNIAYVTFYRMDGPQEDRHVSDVERRGCPTLIGSPDGRLGSVHFNAPMDIYWVALSEGEQVRHRVDGERSVWLQVVTGAVEIEGEELGQGRGVIVEDPLAVVFTCLSSGTELLLIEMLPLGADGRNA